jgi:hypothetical protein
MNKDIINRIVRIIGSKLGVPLENPLTIRSPTSIPNNPSELSVII